MLKSQISKCISNTNPQRCPKFEDEFNEIRGKQKTKLSKIELQTLSYWLSGYSHISGLWLTTVLMTCFYKSPHARKPKGPVHMKKALFDVKVFYDEIEGGGYFGLELRITMA